MLIELLLVIAVGAVLIAIIIRAVDPVGKMKQARDAKRKTDINSIANALRAYEATYGRYPNETNCDSSIGSSGSSCPVNPPQSDWSATSGIYTALVNQGFLKSLPKDPVNNQTYHYRYEPRNQYENPCIGSGAVCRYKITARLEQYANKYFRCSDDETLTAGTGCKEVDGWGL